MIEVTFFTFGTGLRIGVDAAVLDFTRDGATSVFKKIKTIFAFITRIFPMIFYAVCNLEFVGNRRTSFIWIVQEKSGKAQVTNPVIGIRRWDQAIFDIQHKT
jgi:hypothetical protein